MLKRIVSEQLTSAELSCCIQIAVAEVQSEQQRQICSGKGPHTEGVQAASSQEESLQNSKGTYSEV